MRTKSLGILAISAVVAAVAIAAVAFGPANLMGLSNPGSNPGDGTGNGPRVRSPIGAPTWHVGDTWTYDVNESWRIHADVPPTATGNVTKTVVSADGSTYNVSVKGRFHIPDLVDPMRDAPANGVIMIYHRPVFENATVEGYAWYRASDLAKLKDVRTIHVDGSIASEAGTFDGAFTAKVETTYEPALDVWSFPLGENETWNVTSNATTHASIDWRVVGPNVYWAFGRNFTVTVPIHLVLTSGFFEDVTTPAGTFASIPVRVGFAHAALDTDDHRELALDLGNDEAMEHRMPLTFWFSGTAKNVVMASVVLGGHRIDAVLASYHVG